MEGEGDIRAAKAPPPDDCWLNSCKSLNPSETWDPHLPSGKDDVYLDDGVYVKELWKL